MSIVGNTINIKGEWKNSSLVLTNPSNVTMSIYAKDHSLITSSALTAALNVGTGTFETSYVVPSGYGDIIVELVGIIDGKEILHRKNVIREFARD